MTKEQLDQARAIGAALQLAGQSANLCFRIDLPAWVAKHSVMDIPLDPLSVPLRLRCLTQPAELKEKVLDGLEESKSRIDALIEAVKGVRTTTIQAAPDSLEMPVGAF